MYIPNTDDDTFFTNLFLTISSLHGKCIIGGDWNCVLDPSKDRQTGTDQAHNKSRKTILNFMKELHLIDIWRQLKPDDILFSCHSKTFNTYSRIDYFLVSASLLSNIKTCSYDSILISDHAPCNIIYTHNNLTIEHRWCLHQKWLNDEGFLTFVGKEIDEYFTINSSQTSASIRWEAFKACLRGVMIAYTSSKSKEKCKTRQHQGAPRST